MIQAARSKRLRWMQPLPLVPSGSVLITDGVALLEDEQGGVVFIWGRASFSWSRSDSASRRLAAVQLVATGAASQRQAANGKRASVPVITSSTEKASLAGTA